MTGYRLDQDDDRVIRCDQCGQQVGAVMAGPHGPGRLPLRLFMQGLPVYTDANIPVNLGAGTNQDEIYVARFADMIFMEGPIRTEVFRDIGSANATVRFRLYAFVNFFAGRFPGGISRITGTGFVAPTF